MAEERKKPKIDLKTRIPSKTVKGLTPAPGGAIPPPPGAVPAPPPDLMGRRSVPPKVTVDPNDPLAAAKVEGAPAREPQMIVVHADEHHEKKMGKGVVIGVALIGVAVGVAAGWIFGSGSGKKEQATAAKNDAAELAKKLQATQEKLKAFAETTIPQAVNELKTTQQLTQPTIDALKAFDSGFTSGDLDTREIKYFGKETAGKLISYAMKVSHIDSARIEITRDNKLEQVNATLKALIIPKGKVNMGIVINKPGEKDPPMTTATFQPFGEWIELKDKIKDGKLTTKGGSFDVWNGAKGDVFEKTYVSVLDAKAFGGVCKQQELVLPAITKDLEDLGLAITGSGDDPGALKIGEQAMERLKSAAAK
jgi:gas vesicle protein